MLHIYMVTYKFLFVNIFFICSSYNFNFNFPMPPLQCYDPCGNMFHKHFIMFYQYHGRLKF